MRLRQIEIFHAVYANGSISAAARALNVSQPAVSKVLRHTESQLGIRLFDLVRGRLVPTDEAHALFRDVDEVFLRISSLQLTAANLRRSGAGHLRVGVVPSLGLEVAPSVIAAFRVKHPDVTFDIKTLHHHEMLRALYERECDLAIAYDPPQQARLGHRQLASCELMLIAPHRQFGATPDTLAIDDLDGLDMIGVSSSGPIGSIVSAALTAAKVDVREVVSVFTYYVAAALVRRGAGVAIVDEYTARATACAEIDIIPLSPPLSLGVHAIWIEDRPMSKLAQSFVKAMELSLNSLQARGDGV